MINEPITTAAVTTAITAPWWLPYLTNFNLLAAGALTLVTVLWIVTQAIVKWREECRKTKLFKQQQQEFLNNKHVENQN